MHGCLLCCCIPQAHMTRSTLPKQASMSDMTRCHASSHFVWLSCNQKSGVVWCCSLMHPIASHSGKKAEACNNPQCELQHFMTSHPATSPPYPGLQPQSSGDLAPGRAVWPSGHVTDRATQSSLLSAPGKLVWSAGHGVQSSMVLPTLKVPAGHRSQGGVPVELPWPGLHLSCAPLEVLYRAAWQQNAKRM